MDVFAHLGLTPDADERAIRRAYAAKLKECRPDEDPDGFARLVEARDGALALARFRDRVGGTLRWVDDDGLPPTAEPHETAAPEEDPAPSPTTAPSPLDDPSQPRPGGERRPMEELLAWFDGHLRAGVADDPHALDGALRRVSELPLTLRGEFEERLALLLDTALPALRIAGRRVEPLVTAIAAEFGWLTATRRLAEFFDPPDGTQALPTAIFHIVSQIPEPRRDENGVPVIDTFDLVTSLGGQEHPTVDYARRARESGRMGPSWSRMPFVAPAAWFARFYGFGALAASLVVTGLVFALTDSPATPFEAILCLAVLVATYALHLAFGFYSGRWGLLVIHRRTGQAHAAGLRRRDALRAQALTSRWTKPAATLGFAVAVFLHYTMLTTVFEIWLTPGKVAETAPIASRYGAVVDRTVAFGLSRLRARLAGEIGDRTHHFRKLAPFSSRLTEVVHDRITQDQLAAIATMDAEALREFRRRHGTLRSEAFAGHAAALERALAMVRPGGEVLLDAARRHPWLGDADRDRIGRTAEDLFEAITSPYGLSALLDQPRDRLARLLDRRLALVEDQSCIEVVAARTLGAVGLNGDGCPIVSRPHSPRDVDGILALPLRLGGLRDFADEITAVLRSGADVTRSAFAADPFGYAGGLLKSFTDRVALVEEGIALAGPLVPADLTAALAASGRRAAFASTLPGRFRNLPRQRRREIFADPQTWLPAFLGNAYAEFASRGF